MEESREGRYVMEEKRVRGMEGGEEEIVRGEGKGGRKERALEDAGEVR